MTIDDEENLFYMEEGCSIHGEEAIKECNMCANEFCSRCFPNSLVCPDCYQEHGENDIFDEDLDPDFDDVQDLDSLLNEDDDELEQIINESEDFMPDDETEEALEEVLGDTIADEDDVIVKNLDELSDDEDKSNQDDLDEA